jgi:methyltransferase
MVMFWFVLGASIAERLIELHIAARNTKQLLAQGGREVGRSHYPIIVALHSAFFASMGFEFMVRDPVLPNYWYLAGFLFAAAQACRIWVLATMKRRWTTRVIVVPGETLVATGPYRFLSHPNYLVVALEILSLPLIFGLIWTAAIFSLLNAVVLLSIRIPLERQALLERPDYLPRSQYASNATLSRPR